MINDSNIHCINHIENKIEWNLNISFYNMRDAIIIPDKIINSTNDNSIKWQTEIPYDTRQLAVKELISAYTAAISLKNNGYIKSFDMKYKNKWEYSRNFWLDKAAIKYKNRKIELMPRRLINDKYIKINNKRDIKFLEKNPEPRDSQIRYIHGAWYILYVYKSKLAKLPEAKNQIISLDPGVRTFLTGYSPSGILKEYDKKSQDNIKKLHKKIDKYKDARKILYYKRNINKKLHKLERKLNNIVDNMHNQIVADLVNNFNNILLPSYNTSAMLKGNLPSCVKREMQIMASYRFKTKLENKCKIIGRNLVIVDERYTTKTCGVCGVLNDVGTQKEFHCIGCKYHHNRDINAARNIMLKRLL
jgi:putative transposase